MTADDVMVLVLAYGDASREWGKAAEKFTHGQRADLTNFDRSNSRAVETAYEEDVMPALSAALAAQDTLHQALYDLQERTS